MIRASVTAVAVAALLACAVPASAVAKPTKYTGATNAGDRISFKVSGTTITAVRSATPTTCVPTEGTPAVGTDLYQPPGRFGLGRTTKVETPTPVETAMHYSEVTKWFHFTAKRGKRGAISGTLHQNFSFETITSDAWTGVSLLPWVCRGDARFRARPL
jgi:hypothetical protein